MQSQTSKENTGERPHDIALGNDFIDTTSAGCRSKSRVGKDPEQLCAMTQQSFYKTKPKQTDPPDLRVEVNIVQNAEALTVKEIVKKSVVLKNKFFSG